MENEQKIEQTTMSVDVKEIDQLTRPSIIVEGGTEQIKIYKLRPEDIEKYLLMHPVVARRIEIRANRMTSRGYRINPYDKSQRAKKASLEIEKLIN